jgi:predicted dehydrogenase
MSSEGPVSIVLVGIGGMGAVYLRALLDASPSGRCRIEGVVDPFPERCPYLDELRRAAIPIYGGLENFFRQHSAELAVIASPIHFHSPQTCLALDHGCHVLCEKPVAATIQEARRMSVARDASRHWVAVGYQWSFSAAIQSLKADILAGCLGKAMRLKCLYLWPRDDAYYRRNDWAGRTRHAGGAWVLDSPANNAMAHDLHNIFYILGSSRERSATPVEIEAELYRAYDIENFDTAAIRGRTDSGAEFLFYVSHASFADEGPVLHYIFEKGEISAAGRGGRIQARWHDGSIRDYGMPDDEPMVKLWACLELARKQAKPVCGLDAATSQTLCIDGAQESMPEIASFPDDLLMREDKSGLSRTWVKGLDEILRECFEKNCLPSELGVTWSHKGKKIGLDPDYEFSGAGRL